MKNYRSFFMLLTGSLAILSVLVTPEITKADPHKNSTLTLTGRGSVQAEPDIAFISTGVVSEAKTPSKSLSDNNQKIMAIFKLLEKEGVEKKHIQTNNFNIQPIYTHYRPKPGEVQRSPKITGYRVHNNLNVKIVDLQTIGKILTAIVEAGSNQLGDIRFDISNRQELLQQARKKAVQNARAKAELYAEEAGFDLGDIISFREAGQTARPQYKALARSAALEAVADTPIAAGQSDLSISVTVQWEIEQ